MIGVAGVCAIIFFAFGFRRPPMTPCEPRAIVIGDVHGCARELRTLLRRVKVQPGCDMVFFTGDIIGKGPDSVEALREVRSLMLSNPLVEALMGNHEAGFLRWLDAKAANAPLKETSNSPDRLSWSTTLTAEELKWVRDRPLQLALPADFGNVLVVHAGMEPGKPPSQQSRDNLLTIRSLLPNGTGTALAGKGGQRGSWAARWRGPEHIVFGHDARRKLQRHGFATGLDTGLVYGGKLTALILRPTNSSEPGPSFLYGGRLMQVSAQKGSCARQASPRGGGGGGGGGWRGRKRGKSQAE